MLARYFSRILVRNLGIRTEKEPLPQDRPKTIQVLLPEEQV